MTDAIGKRVQAAWRILRYGVPGTAPRCHYATSSGGSSGLRCNGCALPIERWHETSECVRYEVEIRI